MASPLISSNPTDVDDDSTALFHMPCSYEGNALEDPWVAPSEDIFTRSVSPEQVSQLGHTQRLVTQVPDAARVTVHV
jgi:hypothetical protein